MIRKINKTHRHDTLQIRISSVLFVVLALAGFTTVANAFEIPVTFKSEGMKTVRITSSGFSNQSGTRTSSECQITNLNGCVLKLRNGSHLITAFRSDNGPKYATIRQKLSWWISVPNNPSGFEVVIPSHEVKFVPDGQPPRVTGISNSLMSTYGTETRITKFNLPPKLVQAGWSPTTIRMLDGCYTLVYTWPANQSGGGITHIKFDPKPLCVGGEVGHIQTIQMPSKD